LIVNKNSSSEYDIRKKQQLQQQLYQNGLEENQGNSLLDNLNSNFTKEREESKSIDSDLTTNITNNITLTTSARMLSQSIDVNLFNNNNQSNIASDQLDKDLKQLTKGNHLNNSTNFIFRTPMKESPGLEKNHLFNALGTDPKANNNNNNNTSYKNNIINGNLNFS